MLVLLSPAKKQLESVTEYQGKTTEPMLYDDALMLVKYLKKMSQSDIAKIMKISDALAAKACEYYKNFGKADKNPAILLFQGAAYQTLNAEDFDQSDLNYAQNHLVILSGLFGCLRPLDLIQNFRLDMGTPLKTKDVKNLYEYWGDKVTDSVNKIVKKEKHQMIINLASSEYFEVINKDKLAAEIITVDFKELRNGSYKIIGTNAKRARGLMTRYILKNRVEDLATLKKFTGLGYQYNKKLSTDCNYVFSK